jgi:hypothetical protein
LHAHLFYDDGVSILARARAFVAIWPIGVPVLFLLMLLPIRKDLLLRRSTRLVQNTAFLHREYKPIWFFWEAVFVAQRLAIIGFVEYMPRDFNRLQFGLLLTLLYTLALLYVRPCMHRRVLNLSSPSSRQRMRMRSSHV